MTSRSNWKRREQPFKKLGFHVDFTFWKNFVGFGLILMIFQ